MDKNLILTEITVCAVLNGTKDLIVIYALDVVKKTSLIYVLTAKATSWITADTRDRND